MNQSMFARIIAAIISLSFFSGCVSTVSVKKAQPDSPGIRYFLPKPFLQVTPGIDGTVTVQVVYLPDESKEYVVSASSALGSYTFDVSRNDKGFLESVGFNADNTAIASQLITSAQGVKLAQIEAASAAAKADAADAKAKADKAAAALAASEKELAATQLAVDIAQRKLDLLIEINNGPPPKPSNIVDQIAAAKLVLADAVLRRDAAQVALAVASSNISAANAPVKADARPKAPAPAFFRIDMEPKSVKLVEAFSQMSFETWKIPSAEAEPKRLKVLPTSLVLRPGKDSKALIGEIKSDQALLSATFKGLVDSSGRSVVLNRVPILSLKADKQTVGIDFPFEAPAGDFDLDLNFTYGPDAKPKPAGLTFRLRIEK